MKLLLDTHVILWWLTEPSKLQKAAQKAITDSHNEVWISSASIWEIAIKHKLGRLTLPHQFLDILKAQRMSFLPIEPTHALLTLDLPNLHQDPFDRILIAQSKCQDLILITRDKAILKYPILTLKA